MSIELQLLAIVATFVSFGYFVAFPFLKVLTLARLCAYDLIISCAAITVSGALFWGTGAHFSLIVVQVNWFWFSILAYAAMEIPLAFWYMKRNNIDMPERDP